MATHQKKFICIHRPLLTMLSTLVFAVSLNSQLLQAADGPKRAYYRYVNEHGVKVMNHTIPPKFAQNGYEIIDRAGRVLEVVDPAPSAEEKAAAIEQEAFSQRYRELKKRFSSVEEIEAAEARKLESINTNISIQKGNILNINAQINALSKQASDYERANKAVPDQIIASIQELKNQRASVEDILELRYAKIDETKERYAKDKAILTKNDNMKLDDGPIDCFSIVDKSRSLIEKYRKMSRNDRNQGYINSREYRRRMNLARSLKSNMAVTSCQTAAGKEKDFYRCVSNSQTNVIICADKYWPKSKIKKSTVFDRD